jgi:hypothetical protein
VISTDLVDLPIDPVTGDLAFVNGTLTLTSGIAAVAQGIRIRLQMIRGEWFLDLDAGVPYYERDGVLARDAIFAQKWNQAKALRAFRDAILSTPGVDELVQLDITFNPFTRGITVTWQATTAFGDTVADTLATGA